MPPIEISTRGGRGLGSSGSGDQKKGRKTAWWQVRVVTVRGLSHTQVPQSQIKWKSCETGPFIPYLEGLNGFYHQQSKKVTFYLQLSKCILRLTVKKFQCISNFAISSFDLHGILAPEESINWKNRFPCSENHNSKNCLYMKIFRTFLQVHGQENLQNTTVNWN